MRPEPTNGWIVGECFLKEKQMKKQLNVAVVGTGFAGRAHTNAWRQVDKFFDLDCTINLKVVVDVADTVAEFAKRFGFDEYVNDWRTVVERNDIDIIDVITPTYLHYDIVMAAAAAKKHIVCEKPAAISYAQAKSMADAANAVGVVHYLNHNYRKIPAIAYTKQLIDEGRIGTIYHWRGAYFQDWIMDPTFPLTWHLNEKTAGGGALFDIGSHAIDLARYFIGEPKGLFADSRTFITERPLPGKGAATFTAGTTDKDGEKGRVTVDDATFMTIDFGDNILGSIDVSRYGTARINNNEFELYGSKGGIRYSFERMGELEFADITLPEIENGYRTIFVSRPQHPYQKAWWPAGHHIGYEHTFTNGLYDFLMGITKGQPVIPNLDDGVQILRILEAAQLSSKEKRYVRIDEI
jgi:predicted dehydrogenase